MIAANKKTLFLASCLLAIMPVYAQAAALYPNQSGSDAVNYQPYYLSASSFGPSTSGQNYVAPAGSAPQAMPAQASSTSSSSSTYVTSSNFFEPSGDRILSDPLYLPLRGQIYGTSAYTFSSGNTKSYNNTGAKTSNTFNYTHAVAQTLNYGVTDDFELRLAESFAVSGSHRDAASGATSQAYSNGFTDPVFGATYRVFDQRHNDAADWDVLLSYAPDMMSASSPGGGHTGAEATGRQTVTFQSNLGREMNGFTIEGFGGAAYNGERTSTSLANDNIQTNAGYWNYFGGVNTQTRITDRFSINLDGRYNGYNDYEGTNQTTGLTWIGHTANNVDTTIAFNYHFIPNRLVGQFSYDNLVYTTSSKNNNYSVPSNNNRTSNLGTSIFGARLFYTFN